MKYMIIALACIVAVHAHVYGPRGGQGGYRSGGSYDNSGHAAGQSGAHNSGYYNNGLATGYNQGHVEDDLHKEVSHHHSEDHNIGGTVTYGSGGYNSGAHNAYDRGYSNRGNGYQSGYHSGIRG